VWVALATAVAVVAAGAGSREVAFVCDGGTKALSPAMVNDDYCDCQDGTDEAGTSACSHTGVQVPVSSRAHEGWGCVCVLQGG
jgi:hypothetical protein